MIVAIDGTTGSGKSGLCKRLSSLLGFYYIRTGSFYRAIAYKMLNTNVDKDNLKQIKLMLKQTKVSCKFENDHMTVLLDGEDVGKYINSPEVSSFVSKISPIIEIREYVTKIQRQSAKEYDNIIMEGRDIGSVIFPKADIKIFIDCDIDVRAQRRVKQYEKNGITLSQAEAKQAILERDKDDYTRKNSPLVRLPEAFYLDTSNYTMDECVEIVANLIKAKQNKK